VVIAIIAILAAILFPVFAQAREKARGASCLSNLRQLSTGIMMYAQDYDEGLPPSWRGMNTEAPGGCWYCDPGDAEGLPDYKCTWYWPHFTYPYVKNTQIYRCPSSPITPVMDNCPWQGLSPIFGQYGANGEIIGKPSLGLPAIDAPAGPADDLLLLGRRRHWRTVPQGLFHRPPQQRHQCRLCRRPREMEPWNDAL
jgi:type II secretory pathway pseudopilin PulG